MSRQTTNYGLTKPDYTDTADIEVINSNMDIVDNTLKVIDTKAQNVMSKNSSAWSSTTTYTVGQYCIYNNSLWKCLVQHSGQTPQEGTYWTKVSLDTLGAEISAINSNLDNLSSVVDIYAHTFYVSKQGHVVQIQNAAYESSISFTKNETKLVATLPDEFKPPWNIFFPITSLTIPSYVCLVVKTNGQVVLMNLSGSSVTISRWLASSYSYIVTS